MRFSQDFIEKVREATSIVDVISPFTQLKRSGHMRMMGLCPFHNEKTPSFSVSEEKQMYHCFGCKRAGNSYTFVQEMQGLSFPEAVESLAQKAGITLPADAYDKNPQDDRREHQKLLYRINRFAAMFYHQQLMSLQPSHPVREYIHKRGIKPEMVNKFLLGYAPEEWESLAQAIGKKGVALSDAETLGLVKSRTQGKSGHYDIFRHRLIFPIVSITDNFLGFGGRILGEGQPKYLNSPESEIFHKGKVFYGLHESAKHIRVEDAAIVVEGYTDFLALFQAGITNVVATLGTALTHDHARLLKRYTKNVIVLFDGDSAGREAAARSLPILLSEGLLPRGLTLEDDYDPDEYIVEKGADALKAKLRAAPELFVEILRHEMTGYRGTAAEKVALMDRMTPVLFSCADSRLRDLYIQELAERLQVEAAWVIKALKGSTKDAPIKAPQVSAPEGTVTSQPPPNIDLETIVIKKAPRAELYLLNVALMKEEYYQEVMASGVIEALSHEGIREAFKRAEHLYRQRACKFDNLIALLVPAIDPPEAVSLLLAKPLSDLQNEGLKKLISDCTKKIREANFRAKSKQIAAHLRGQESGEQVKNLEQIMNIHRDRHSLNKE